MTSIALTKATKPTKKPVYDYEETGAGVWKTYHYPNGQRYREFQSYVDWFGLPLISFTSGIHPELGERKTAHGAIAIGWKARGFVAIGQFCQGYIAIGQFAVSRVLAIGQFTLAPISFGQMAIGVFCLSQMGISLAGIHQMGITFAGGIGQLITTLF